ncbi:helix-turn-helix domain-containing protein [Lentzea kentuckyensis]|uniref:helix-turn-helix domain-containing protein n=1 Tax=Lentzea kentuckyensis TaxID=360086 RepID=UPI000A39C0C8|nr:helix-turn-helix transcriptional regulator [Lentzea kentuckyensis]
MATTTQSTAYSRQLGDELRKLRETCTGLTGAALAVRLGWDPSKLSTIENGKYRASEIDLVQYLSKCDKDIDFFEDFKRRYRHAFDEYIVQTSDNLRTLAMAESTAKTIMRYDTQSVTGLLQTAEYADAWYRMGGFVAEDRIPSLVQFRTDRQSLLLRHDRPDCLFYIHEHALQMQVGDSRIMEDQYFRLLYSAQFIRVVPVGAPVIAANCTLWEFDKARPVAFIEGDLVNVFVQDPSAIVRARLLFDRLAEVALDAEQSRSRLAEYAGQPREDLDDSGTCMA